jgi:hypothetical protein
MSTLDFYIARAAECRRDAEAASLDNVRNRSLSAAEAWEQMADRARRTQSFRAAHEAEKAAVPAEQH